MYLPELCLRFQKTKEDNGIVGHTLQLYQRIPVALSPFDWRASMSISESHRWAVDARRKKVLRESPATGPQRSAETASVYRDAHGANNKAISITRETRSNTDQIMGKGKRRGGLSGVSKFVLESMKPTSYDTTSNLSQENPPLMRHGESAENRPAKRRKGNNGVPMNQTELADLKWVDKYDATGLVPHYTHHSQVPAHLQKCMSCCTVFPTPTLTSFLWS